MSGLAQRLGTLAAVLAVGAATPQAVAFPGMARTAGSSSAATSGSAAPAASSAAPALAEGSAAPPVPAAPPPRDEPPRDAIVPREDLAAGTLLIEVRSGNGQPLVGRPLTLEITRETVAEGISRERRALTADAQGQVRVEGLAADTSHRYRVLTTEGPAEYSTQEFPLDRRRGQGVLLHVFPWSSTLSEVLVGFRAMIYVQPRDDVFQLEVMFTLHNVGAVTWVPQGVSFELPEGAKAFTTEEAGAAFRARDGRVELIGTYPPGSRDIGFRFQLPNDGEARAEWTLALPPHVAELRVATEASRDMTLEARARATGGVAMDLPDAEVSRSAKGERVLITGRGLRPGEPELSTVTVALAGLPTRGEGRTTAVVLALLVAALGAAAARSGSTRRRDDLARARAVLEGEVLRLDTSLASGAIGPETHAQARARLVEALVRLEGRLGAAAQGRRLGGRSPAPR